MRPGFRLNVHDRDKNPLFEAHDPSMMWDPVSGYYYSYSTDAAITSVYRQGIPVRRSRDLVNFEFVGYALSEKAVAEGRDNGDYPPTGGFWAPYTEYVAGEYRMYYSATKAFGSSESRIWLAVSKQPEGPFENRGIVADTWNTDDTLPNAIDAHVIHDQERCYLVYGSFFGGIYLKELNPKNGLAKECGGQGEKEENPVGLMAAPEEAAAAARRLGVRIAVKPQHSYIDGPEGAAIIYHPEEGYFYLFLSYGWLGDDYDIRAGRSRSVQGPYLDYQGRSLNGESLGTKLAGSYRFLAKAPYAEKTADGWSFGGFRGPGHGVPFYNEPGGDYFFVHHVRDGAENLCYHPKKQGEKRSYRMHYMVVRRMYFIGGWPAFSPEPYAGEEAGRQLHIQIGAGDVRAEGRPLCTGENDWEWICFEQNRNELIQAQGMPEPERKNAADVDAGTGQLTVADVDAGTGQLTEADVVLGESFDFENSSRCMTVTGYTKQGTVIWGKKRVII